MFFSKEGHWEVRRCIWPYPEGYATYNAKKNTILDTGLDKELAQELCDMMNKEIKEKRKLHGYRRYTEAIRKFWIACCKF